MKFFSMMVCVCSLVAASAAAADNAEVKSLGDAASPPAKIEMLSWMVGHWQGEGLGGTAMEVFAPPAGGQMMGMFRHIKGDGAPNFYELYLISEVGETVVLRLKHFSPDFVGWEEKDGFVEFPLVEITADAVYFDGLTFAMSGPDEMQAAVNVSGQGVISFQYRRVKFD